MVQGQEVFILCRLVFGALASFLAIMLWARNRDVAWIFVIFGTIITYIETVYSILNTFGIGGGNILTDNWDFIVSMVLTCLPTLFFIAGLTVMVARKYRRR